MTLDQEPTVLYTGTLESVSYYHSRRGWFGFFEDVLRQQGITTEISEEAGLIDKVRSKEYRGIIFDGSPIRPINLLVGRLKAVTPKTPVLITLYAPITPTIRWAFKTGATDILEQTYTPEPIIKRLKENGII